MPPLADSRSPASSSLAASTGIAPATVPGTAAKMPRDALPGCRRVRPRWAPASQVLGALLLHRDPQRLLLLLPPASIFLSLSQSLSSLREISVYVRQGNGTCSYCWTLVQNRPLVRLCACSRRSSPGRAPALAARRTPCPPPPAHTQQTLQRETKVPPYLSELPNARSTEILPQ